MRTISPVAGTEARSAAGGTPALLTALNPLDGERHGEGGPRTFAALDLDMAAVFFDNAVSHRQAQAGAPPHLLGGVKGIKDLGEVPRVDAHPGVRHVNDHPLAVGRRVGADLEGAPVQHGLDGVDEQIEKDLLQAFLFAPDGRQVRRGNPVPH